jgi:hypothetical protein
LAVPYEELSWALDTNEDEENRMAVLLLQFLVTDENGEQITKILQVFSSQVSLCYRERGTGHENITGVLQSDKFVLQRTGNRSRKYYRCSPVR